ncbi:hypothetical protein [Stenoxybacter acetivorans]|nr:hypothetical protein [Stenoxybacter acetivorans]
MITHFRRLLLQFTFKTMTAAMIDTAPTQNHSAIQYNDDKAIL